MQNQIFVHKKPAKCGRPGTPQSFNHSGCILLKDLPWDAVLMGSVVGTVKNKYLNL
jgi:hypothetical protein